jgi:hypothetical protein
MLEPIFMNLGMYSVSLSIVGVSVAGEHVEGN